MIEIIEKYFPELSENQIEKFKLLKQLYIDWNSKINVISRKDIDFLYEKHILHSLSIAKIISFSDGTSILDVGTGGGFPGIPLAILFPKCNFYLIDSIQKKIKVVNAISESIHLTNVVAEQARAESINKKFDFIISRAVTSFPEFYGWVKNKINKKSFNKLQNGIIYLKGGDLIDELKDFNPKVKVYEIADIFSEDFFLTKKIVYLPI